MIKINRLAEVLEIKKITNRELAEKIKKTEETVSRWVNNHRQPPLTELYKIAKLLDTDIRELLYPTKP
ncbi:MULTISPECIES: helix-turn-helix transcriptional regulator [Sphingobacterium]|uniref:Transcriptional regulator n=1 Tax=Sphingobacterium athyrii TaxID=2152717 RepID=A0A363NUW8_9SPHI|nr:MULTISPECIES: helix-turn-helix transcriptional regulator [Sphingobacterium]PUV24579.1 transcriptional regulator [Sphingobacterium athyrii]